MKIIHLGRVDKGLLKLYNRKLFDSEIEVFEGEELEITIQKKKKSRSSLQNRYYWGIVIPMIKEGFKDLGHRLDSEETHDFLKSKFNTIEIIDDHTGEVVHIPKSTTELTTVSFNDFKAQIQQWAAEFLNISIPDPGEQATFEFK